MSFTRLLPENSDDDNNETNEMSETGVIVKDVVPHSDDDFDCACTCACCPNLSNWCIKDAFGLSCAIITWILFLYGDFVFVFVILTPKSFTKLFYLINLLLFQTFVFLAVSSHFRTMFSNPGAVPLHNATPEHLSRYENGTTVYRCTKCESIKPPQAHHCRICKRCIKRMDHHCVFVNNCVGQNNQKYFVLFTFYTFILTTYALIVIGFQLKTCILSNWIECPAWSPPATILFSTSVILEALAFSIFTLIMFCSQLYSIYTDTNQIEMYKSGRKSNREKRPFMESFKMVFGSRVGLTWLNPFSVPIYLVSQNDERIKFDV